MRGSVPFGASSSWSLRVPGSMEEPRKTLRDGGGGVQRGQVRLCDVTQ